MAILGKREPEDDLKTKPILKKLKEKSKEKETKSNQTRQGKKRLFVGNLSEETKISDIIDFFHNVGGVIRITLIVTQNGEHTGYGFVEFASVNEARKALEKKNGEYLQNHKISVEVATKEATYPPKYCIDHKIVWYEDYLRGKSLLIEENETVEGDDDLDTIRESAVRKKTLFIADLSPQTEIVDVCKFFFRVGQVVSLRLIVNHEGKHLGYGFVEFVSANEAENALEKKKGEYLHDHKIFLDVAKKGTYPPRPEYEDYFRREEEDEIMEKVDEDPDFVEEVAVEEKTLLVSNLSPITNILDICKFFHFAGEVVHVRLNVDHKGKHAGYGFVEFASANEAKKALEGNTGEYKLHNSEVILDVAKTATYPPRPKYNLVEKLWYEDYIRRESLRIEEEDETVEGLVQEVAITKKTLFLNNLPFQFGMSDIGESFSKNGVRGIVGQRLIVNHEGKHVGSAFVEFASVYEAEMAQKKMKNKYLDNRKIFIDMAKIASYPPRLKYNLAEKLWYKDPFTVFCGTKTTFVNEDEAF